MPQTLTVTEHFQLGRFGQVLMSSGGRLQQPTNVVAPGAPAAALQAANDLNKIIFDDASQGAEPRPDPVRPRRPAALREQHAARRRHGHRHRRGDDLHLGRQRRERQRLPACDRSAPSVAGCRDFQPRQPAPRPRLRTGGRDADVRVAGMNLLNFFDTFDDSTGGDHCTSASGGDPATAAAPTPRPSSTGRAEDRSPRSWRSAPTCSASTRSRTTATARTARSSTSSTG